MVDVVYPKLISWLPRSVCCLPLYLINNVLFLGGCVKSGKSTGFPPSPFGKPISVTSKAFSSFFVGYLVFAIYQTCQSFTDINFVQVHSDFFFNCLDLTYSYVDLGGVGITLSVINVDQKPQSIELHILGDLQVLMEQADLPVDLNGKYCAFA